MKAVVIGGGVVGLTSAYELCRAGYKVALVETDKVGQAASHGNAAKITYGERGPVPAPGVLLQGLRWMMRPDSPLSIAPSFSPGYIKFLLSMAKHCNEKDFHRGLTLLMRMGENAKELLDGYRADGIEFEMHERSNLLAFETKARYEEALASLDVYSRFGVEPQRLCGDQVFEAEPALNSRIRFGLNVTEDRQIEPDSLTRSLAKTIIDRGGSIREGVAAVDFVKKADLVTHVKTSDGDTLDTDLVVLANGAGVRALSTKLGTSVPVHPGKGYSLDYSPAPIALRTALTLEDARVAVTPLDGFIRLAGTMEFGRYNSKVSRVRVEAIRRAARESLRGWAENEVGERTPWAGLRPMTPDGLPVVGALAGWRNAYVSGGHGMLGLTLAPSTAKILVDLVTCGRPELQSADLAALSPNRFMRSSRRLAA